MIARPLLLGAVVLLAAAPAGRAESLDQALADAYQHNPQLQAARAGQSAAQHDVSAARGGWLPKLALTGGISRDNTSGKIDFGSGFPPINFGDSLDQSRVALRLDQPVWEGGTLSAKVSAAEDSASAAHASTRAQETRVLLDAAQAYLAVVQSQAVLAVQKDNVNVIRRQLDASQQALTHGEGTRTDVAQAKSRLEAAVAARIQARADVARAQARYRRVIGHDPGSVSMPDHVPDLPATLKQAEALATQNFPVVAARFRAQAASEQADAAAGKLLPKIGLYAEVRRQNQPQYGFSQVTDRVIGLDVSIPIWQGGTRHAQTAAARERARQASLKADSASDQARDQAVSAWQQYLAARSSVSARRSQLESARVAYQGVKAEHEHGERTLLDVLNAEQEVRNARVAVVKAHRDRVMAAYSLLGATGGLTARGLRLPLARRNGNGR